MSSCQWSDHQTADVNWQTILGALLIILKQAVRSLRIGFLGARRAMPVVQPLPRRRRSERRRGMDPELVNTFPTYLHDAEKLAKGISQTPKAEQARQDPASSRECKIRQ